MRSSEMTNRRDDEERILMFDNDALEHEHPPAYETTDHDLAAHVQDSKDTAAHHSDVASDSTPEYNSLPSSPSSGTATPSSGADYYTPGKSQENPEARKYTTANDIKCSLLPDRVAVFHVKDSDMNLCGLAAMVILKQQLIKENDLQLLPQFTKIDDSRDPTDPISGVAFATYDTVGEIMHGVAEGPLEASRSDNVAKGAAVGTAKGVGRIIGAGLKAPMNFTYETARGFHNAPKLYGDKVREVDQITGVESGLTEAWKGLGYGLYDGISGFFVEPIKGAQKEKGIGFLKGVGKGIGGMVFKPAAGAVGLPGYAFKGIYKEIQNHTRGPSKSVFQLFLATAEEEYGRATNEERVEILNLWFVLTSGSIRL